MQNENNELTIQVTTGKRRITLDPLRTKALTNVEVREVETTLPCGMRMEWLEIEDEEGNKMQIQNCIFPWITFEYKGRGFCLDMRQLALEVIAFADESEGK